MALVWEQVVVDARDPQELGRWWAEALGWVTVDKSPDEVEIRPALDVLPGLLFLRVPGAKVDKNRLHIDLRPDDQAAEVARLVALGATETGRNSFGEEFQWVTLADPEGNAFCVSGG